MSAQHPTGPEMTFTGRAWIFGDEVNTDDMYPGFAMKLPLAEGAMHMFDATRRDWPQLVRPGDVVVGGRNFGIGSSRSVALLFLELGVRCLLAEQFNSLFLRNCINFGLPALNLPGVASGVAEGDLIEVDVAAGSARNQRTGEQFTGSPIPEFLLRVLRGGGLINQLERDGYISPA
jgi:3-isopropylmalate/(R)-2-methylmalate dehydratase small subunit